MEVDKTITQLNFIILIHNSIKYKTIKNDIILSHFFYLENPFENFLYLDDYLSFSVCYEDIRSLEKSSTLLFNMIE